MQRRRKKGVKKNSCNAAEEKKRGLKKIPVKHMCAFLGSSDDYKKEKNKFEVHFFQKHFIRYLISLRG